MKKTLAILLALVMILSLATTAFAAEATTGTITITNAAVGETYSVIKLFSASVSTTTTGEGENATTTTNIVYTGDIPSDLISVFTKNSAGNIVVIEGKTNEDVVAAVQAWAKEQTPAEGNSKIAESETVTFENLPFGYYAVTTTQGSVVTVDSTTPTATVEDKNSAPSVDKDITGASDLDEDGENAIAQVGSTVTYEATITVGTGAKNYVYHDTMDSGLSYVGITSIVLDPAAEGEENKTLAATTDYVVKTGDDAKHTEGEGESATTTQHTFDVDFTDALEATLKNGDTIVITYTATVTSDALTTDPANNTAYVSYGNAGKTTEDSTAVYNATITVVKTDGTNYLAGAGFVLSKTVADTSEGAADGATKTVYYKLENGVVSWVDSVNDATELFSDSNGKLVTELNGTTEAKFTGLSSGTYNLVENTVPDGYNKASDTPVTIKEDNYDEDNLVQSKTIVNNSGAELPTTGGIGTTLFYIVGAVLVIGAAIVLVTKKRMSAEA